jgi:hypothetical protein
MRGRWAIALLMLLLVPAVWAQRGGGHSGASMGHSGFAARGPAMTGHGGMIGGGFRTGRHPGFGSQPFFSNRGFRHRRFVFGTVPWGYYNYPGSYYSYLPYADYGYSSSSDSNPYPPEYRSDYYGQRTGQLQAEIDRLEDEVQRLREERESRAPPQAQAKSEVREPTVLVFADKHTQEVENYAIVGQTLWVFSELHAAKIPLSSLDLDATTKANDERGVDFHVLN